MKYIATRRKQPPTQTPAPEPLTKAWNRWVEVTEKTMATNARSLSAKMPIQLQGRTVADLSQLTTAERQSIDISLRQGYTTQTNPRWVAILRLIVVVTDFRIGYLCRSNAGLWLPDTNARNDCMRQMMAYLAINRDFEPSDIRPVGNKHILIRVSCKDRGTKSFFTGLRPIVDECMQKWEAPRYELADTIRDGNLPIVRNFDSDIDYDYL